MPRRLRVFLCHATQDKPAVYELYKLLTLEGWIDPWLAEEKLLPGQSPQIEIPEEISQSDLIIICLSNTSIMQEGYIQKEIAHALDVADEKLDTTIFIIPLRLEECKTPRRLSRWKEVDYFVNGGYEELRKSLLFRAIDVGVSVGNASPSSENLDLYKFVEIEDDFDSIDQRNFYISKYPVTNAQYERFLMSADFFNKKYWINFPKNYKNVAPAIRWSLENKEGLAFVKKRKPKNSPTLLEDKQPKYWNDPKFGIFQPNNPVVGVTWLEANAYCRWLETKWKYLPEGIINKDFSLKQIRLPAESEWLIAAGGNQPFGRFPWDRRKSSTLKLVDLMNNIPLFLWIRKSISKKYGVYWQSKIEEIINNSNTKASNIGYTTAVNTYQEGGSPYGVMDMAGNVWEWQATFENGGFLLSGGSWTNSIFSAVAGRSYGQYLFDWKNASNNIGFRVVATQND